MIHGIKAHTNYIFRKIILFSFQPYEYFQDWTRNTPEIVNWIKLEICQSQMKSYIDWKCYHYTGKSMASLENKNTKLKTKTEIDIKEKK